MHADDMVSVNKTRRTVSRVKQLPQLLLNVKRLPSGIQYVKYFSSGVHNGFVSSIYIRNKCNILLIFLKHIKTDVIKRFPEKKVIFCKNGVRTLS